MYVVSKSLSTWRSIAAKSPTTVANEMMRFNTPSYRVAPPVNSSTTGDRIRLQSDKRTTSIVDLRLIHNI